MTDQLQTIREDLAFMKALTSDAGPPPRIAGLHFIAPGLIFGLPVVGTWAAMSGYIGDPGYFWRSWVWVLSTIVYLPVLVWLIQRGKTQGMGGPTQRAFAALWSSVGLTSVAIIAVLVVASARMHEPRIFQIWPAVCFAIYGAAWHGVGVARRSWGFGLVGLGCYATAIANSFLIGSPYEMLGLAIGIQLWLTGPGVVMLLRGRPSQATAAA